MVFLVAMACYSCNRDEFANSSKLFTVSLNVHLPAYYNNEFIEGVAVKLINQSNSLYETELTDEYGNVTFQNVIKGSYRISANIKISATTAKSYGDTVVSDIDISKGRNVNMNCSMADVELGSDTDLGTLVLTSSIPGSLLIKEVFYTGTRTDNDKSYYSDHFIEIYNNSDEIIYADSLYLANAYGANGNTYSDPSGFQDQQDLVALEFVFMIPGSGKEHPIYPGSSIIIAQDGMNHRLDENGNPNSIDLSSADWESFLYRPDNQKDVDFAEVPNLEEVFDNRYGTFDWILHSYGSSIVIFRTTDPDLAEIVPEPYDEEGHEVMLIPVDWVLDAFEALAYPTSGKYKRIPDALDAGFIYCNGIYNGESCRRKVEDIIDRVYVLQDFNNTSEDFEVISFPTPGVFE